MKFTKYSSSKKLWLQAAALTFVITATYLYYDTLAWVDGYRITRSQVKYKNKINKIYNPAETRDLGLDQLIRTRVRFIVLKNQGIDIRDQDLEAESQRIDNQSLDPAKLKDIKNLFGSKKNLYLQVFILPTLVDQKIFSIYNFNNQNLNDEAFKKAQNFIDALAKGNISSFESLAEYYAATVRELAVSTKRGLKWGSIQKQKTRPFRDDFQNPQFAQKLEQDHFQKLQLNTTSPQPIDMQDTLWVPLLINKTTKNKNDRIYQIKVALFPKEDPSARIESESKKIKVYKFWD